MTAHPPLYVTLHPGFTSSAHKHIPIGTTLLHKMIGKQQQQPSITDTDAAMSLCVLSGSREKYHLVSPSPTMDMDADAYPTLSPATVAAIALPNVVEEESTPISANLVQDFQAAVPTNPTNVLAPKAKATNALSPPSKKQSTTRGKYNKRFHPVSFDEMKRLMRVYGPIKCLRNRNNNQTFPDANAKDTSIKRKFYRWFPDFNERFVMTEGSWFMPKYGHEHEMKYREAMRRSDQQVLTKKRSAKRCGPKSSFEVPAVMNGNTVSIPL